MPLDVARPRAAGTLALLDRVANRLSERTNPLFVKELRQALRSRYFKITFGISLAITTIAGLVVMAIAVPLIRENAPGNEGVALFVTCLACTALGAVGLVPFAAFTSMNAEADENALELLQLSNLSPLSIVSGKLASALVQAVLVTSTVLPFAALAWMLGGLSPWVVVLAPLFAIAASVCLSAMGIALSTLSRTRWVRVLLMVLFGFFLFNVGQNVIGLAVFAAIALVGVSTFGATIPGVSIGGAAAGAFAILGAQLAIAVTFASDMLAHREESGSTPMRRVATAIALLGALATGIVTLVVGGDAGLVVLFATLATIAAPLAWCCTESEALPLGTRARPPRTWLGALHVAGGGRGALLSTVLLALLGVEWSTCCAIGGDAKALLPGLVFVAFTWIYLLLPTVVFSPFSKRVAVRVVARIATWMFPWFMLFAGAVVAALFVGPGGEVFDHPWNPGAVFDHVQTNGVPRGGLYWTVLPIVLLVTLAANAWRMLRGVLDVRRAMLDRDARATGAERVDAAERAAAQGTP